MEKPPAGKIRRCSTLLECKDLDRRDHRQQEQGEAKIVSREGEGLCQGQQKQPSAETDNKSRGSRNRD